MGKGERPKKGFFCKLFPRKIAYLHSSSTSNKCVGFSIIVNKLATVAERKTGVLTILIITI